MASSMTTSAFLVLAFVLFVQGTLGNIECENLNKNSCSFAVSSTGKRCVLEKHVRRTGAEEYACAASDIEADKVKDWIETDACVAACRLDRSALGISSDSLLEPHFTRKLCSDACYGSCPNIVDLYFNLAAGEGVYLPKLCESQRSKTRRGMWEIRSSGYAAPAPGSTAEIKSYGYDAPAPVSLDSVEVVAASPPANAPEHVLAFAPSTAPVYLYPRY